MKKVLILSLIIICLTIKQINRIDLNSDYLLDIKSFGIKTYFSTSNNLKDVIKIFSINPEIKLEKEILNKTRLDGVKGEFLFDGVKQRLFFAIVHRNMLEIDLKTFETIKEKEYLTTKFSGDDLSPNFQKGIIYSKYQEFSNNFQNKLSELDLNTLEIKNTYNIDNFQKEVSNQKEVIYSLNLRTINITDYKSNKILKEFVIPMESFYYKSQTMKINQKKELMYVIFRSDYFSRFCKLRIKSKSELEFDKCIDINYNDFQIFENLIYFHSGFKIGIYDDELNYLNELTIENSTPFIKINVNKNFIYTVHSDYINVFKNEIGNINSNSFLLPFSFTFLIFYIIFLIIIIYFLNKQKFLA
jgi:hypothetical protein